MHNYATGFGIIMQCTGIFGKKSEFYPIPALSLVESKPISPYKEKVVPL